jgi:hypothetical protein
LKARLPIALILSGLVALAAACSVNIPAATDKKLTKKPTSTPVVAVSAATPAPTDDPNAVVPVATPSKAAGPFDEAGLPGPPPPFRFPYAQAGVGWVYALHVKAGAFPVDGTATISVKTVLPTESVVQTVLKITAAFLGGGDKPNSSLATIKRSVENPFSLAALMASGKATAQASKLGGALETSSSIGKWNHERLHVDAGDYDCDKYLINEVAGPSITKVVLWIDQATGILVKQQIDSDKLPDLGSSLSIPAGIPLGKTTTTLSLKGKATGDMGVSDPTATGAIADPHASGAVTDPKASGASDPNASGAATPNPNASALAAMGACAGGRPQASPDVGSRGQGAYEGLLLPNGYLDSFGAEGAVTAAISALADKAGATASPSPTGSASTAPSPSPTGSASPVPSPSPTGSASPVPSPSATGSASPAPSGAANDWTTFKCLYPAALKVWRDKTGRTD